MVVVVAPTQEQARLLKPSIYCLVLLDSYTDLGPALKTYHPALLVFDYGLSPAVSLQICRTLRQRDRWRETPILFLLPTKTASTIEQVFAAGASDVVSQPLVGPELIARLTQWLRPSLPPEQGA